MRGADTRGSPEKRSNIGWRDVECDRAVADKEESYIQRYNRDEKRDIKRKGGKLLNFISKREENLSKWKSKTSRY
uniref:Uncharacterized protein n=1 Tax=Megaselia scalaris TaxID=36166 RepID=T1GYX4_MEGSC